MVARAPNSKHNSIRGRISLPDVDLPVHFKHEISGLVARRMALVAGFGGGKQEKRGCVKFGETQASSSRAGSLNPRRLAFDKRTKGFGDSCQVGSAEPSQDFRFRLHVIRVLEYVIIILRHSDPGVLPIAKPCPFSFQLWNLKRRLTGHGRSSGNGQQNKMCFVTFGDGQNKANRATFTSFGFASNFLPLP